MIKKISIVAFVLCAFSIQSTQAQAAILSFDPSSQSVGLGDPVTVDLRISDLDNNILTGFDLEISFDDSILSFQSFTVGPGATGLDPFGLDSGAFSYGLDLFFGIAAVGDLSFEPDAILQANQPDSFVLGTLNFDTLSLGTSALDISFALLASELDASGFATELQADLQAGSVTVAPPAVIPVPAAVWLFGTGLIGLIGFSRRRKTFVGG